MTKLYETLSIFLLIIFLGFGQSNAQNKLWPGDANNNGVANCVDLLYIGVGFDETGPTRQNATTLWQEQTVDSLWTNDYQDNTTNYAYGDCNGDGTIDNHDVEMAIKANYLLMHTSSGANSNADAFGPSVPNQPVVTVTPDVTTITEGEQIQIDLNLGDAILPLDSFYGVAMMISYDRPFVSMSAPVQFTAATNSFADPTNIESINQVFTDTLNQQVEFAYVRTDRQNAASGYGTVGTFSFIIDDDVIAPKVIDTITIKIDSVRLIDKNLNTIPVSFEAASFEVEVLQSARSSNATNCPQVFDPVCGINGVTYMNSCFAKVAGITEFTSGICYSECIDPTEINEVALQECSNNYIPVCGCNDVTYLNSCVAENSGITEYTLGSCVDNEICFDPSLIVSSSGADIDRYTGVVTLDCETNYDPVCGCDGFTYQNSCLAEASGIAFYTQGPCNNVCVDADAMDPYANCLNVYEPVCGCNDVTYTNACFADAAGVVSYTNGACGATSSDNWCTGAAPIQCGDYLASETTIGAGNDINTYYWNTSVQYLGPDKVYVINKDQAGDLQIGLEIITPNINLDLFLLSGDCENLTCIAASQSSNTNTNNEGIVLENAPIGTYYIVVDGLLPSYQGDFKLEVSCGDLDCNNEIWLDCGTPFNYNNAHGNDNVSAYSCGSVLNVENNGNEVVHTFTVTQTGQVDIYLSNLSANLELFLLSDCDRGECFKYSSHPGSADEHISTYLQPGTYYVIVDGYNGATSNYQLLVDCPSTCDIEVTGSASGTNCGQSNGSFTVNSTGGTPGFIVSWTGPVSGSFSTSFNTCTIYNLPPGTYEITKTDANGCSDSITLEIEDFGSQLDAALTVNNAVCNTKGSVGVVVSNGTAPYLINVSGPISGTATAASHSFNINQLPAGDYNIFITDKFGCTVHKSFTVAQENNNFTISGYTTPSHCESLGKIHISLSNGSPLYTIHVSGPVSGSATTYSNNFNIPNLPGGTYTVLIEDSNWCSVEMTFVIEEKDIDIDLVPTNGLCGENGALTINISNGTPNYSIAWSGPSSGNVTSSASSFTIPNLPSGSYSVTVMDANWCQDYQVATIDNSESNLDVSITTVEGTCASGSLWIDINDGTAPYTITYSGPQNGSGTTTTNGFDISNLLDGTYTVLVTDQNNCTYTEEVILDTGDSSINLSAWPNDGTCGDLGNIEVTVTNGTSPYTITYGGSSPNTVMSSSPVFIIEDLISGNYNIEVTDDNGCMDWATAVLNNTGSGMTISTAPWNGTCGTPGEITIDINGGTLDYDIVWDGPSSGAASSSNSTYTINNALSGSYGVTVTDSQGCVDEAVQVIDNNSNNLNIVVDPTNGQCGSPGSIGITVSGANPPYNIMWSGPQNGSGTTDSNFSLSNLDPGIYTITVVSDDGCSKTTEIEIINEGEPPVVSISTAASVCGSGGTINILYDAPSADITWTGPVSGSASSSNGSFIIDNAVEGWYDIVVSVGNGCDVTVGAEIIEIENEFDFTITPTNAVCQENGSANINFESGSFDIVWMGPVNGNIVDNTGSYTIQNLPAGDYSVSLIDIDGCKKTKYFTISVEQTIVDVQVMGTNGICDQLGSILVSFDTPSAVVSWSGPSSGSSSASGGTFNILSLVSGGYDITVEAPNGCLGNASVEIENITEDVVISATPIDAICNTSGSIEITAGADVTSVSYTGPITGTPTLSNGSASITNAPAGIYTLTSTNNNGCSSETQLEISTSSSMLNLVADPVNGSCNENGGIKLTFTSGDVMIEWNGPVSGSSMVSNGTLEVQGLPAGDYTIKVTDSNGCEETAVVTVMIMDSNLAITSDISNADCCDAGSISINVSGGEGQLTYNWMPDISSNNTAIDLDAGVYMLTVTDENGCTVDASFNLLNDCDCPDFIEADTLFYPAGMPAEVCVPIPFLEKDLYNIILNDLDYMLPVMACDIDTLIQYSYVVLFGLGQDGPYSIDEWQANGQVFSGQVQTMQDLADSLNVWDPSGNWTHQPAQFSIVGGDSSGAYGNIKATHLGSGVESTMNINFTGIATGFSLIVDDNKPTQELIIMDTVLCCSDTVTIVFGGGCEFSITESHTDVECNQMGTVDLNFINGTAPYEITQTGEASGSYSAPDNSLAISGLLPGTYTFLVSDAEGCGQDINVIINENTAGLQVSANAQSDMCGTNGTATINIVGGVSDYTVEVTGPSGSVQTISNNDISFTGLASGSYTVSVSDVNGCMGNTSFVINNSNSNILSVITTAVNGSCGQSSGFLLNISGGTPSYTINWNGPEFGSTTTNNNEVNVIDLTSGTYNIEVVDSNGCSFSDSVTISNNTGNFNASLESTDAYCDVLGSLWLTVITGTPPYLVEWSGPQSGSYSSNNVINDISNLPVGTYTASITDANGCSESAVLTIGDNGVPTSFSGVATNPTNTNDGSIAINILTSNPNHTISWTGPSSGTVTIGGQFFNITGLIEGAYSVSVDDKDGCSSAQTFVLTNSDTGTGNGGGTGGSGEFAVNVNPTDMTCGEPGNLFLNLSNGSAPFEISWSGQSSGSDITSNSIYSITNLDMGSYNVIVTDASGNSSLGSATIGGSGAFDIITSTNNGSCGNDDGSISIVVNSGTPNYNIFWSGPVSDNAVFTNNAITIDDLASGTYDITVSDANDCAQIFTTVVDNSAGGPEANFSSVSEVLTTFFTNYASSGLYSWDFGDGNTSTATNPAHEYCEAGTYTVCLTVTNTCGSNMVCSDVSVSLPNDIVVLDVQDGSGATGGTISVPVTIANCETIVSLAGSLQVDDASVCTISGVSPGLISPNYFAANSTFSYVNNNGNGVNISDGDILFYLDIELIGEANESTAIHITDNPLLVEVGSMINGLATVLPSVELKGTVSVSSSARISGNVKTYWGEGIKNTEITIQSDNMMNTQMTDSLGYYMEPDLPMGDMYSIIPARDFNDQNGLSSYALFVGQRFILGMDPMEIVSPYQVIAGDANCSNSFTTIDLFILQQLIIGTTDGLDFCPSWTFVKETNQMPADFDAYNVFPYDNLDQVMVMSDEVSNFVGVKVGDILGHANPSNLGGDQLSKYAGKLDFYVNQVSAKKGESFDLVFSSDNFNDIVSYQLGLAFDEEKLSFDQSIKSEHEELAGTAIGETLAENGRLATSWYSLDGDGLTVDQDAKLFTLRFKAEADIEDILDYIRFDNKTILTEAHNEHLERLDITLNVLEESITSTSSEVSSAFNLSQNVPNPFIEQTQIEFYLPSSTYAEFTVTNVLGETVKTIAQNFKQGKNVVTLNQNELGGTGVFQYTITAGDRSITKSMISIK